MTRIRYRSEFLFNMICACLLLLLAACGGSSGLLADGGIGGTGIVSSGSVSSLGSIVVNGVDYRVSGANYTREDEVPVELLSESQTAIKVGMVVEVDGELDDNSIDGQALTIRYEDVLEGPIEAVDTLGGTVKVLTILNQQVIVEEGFTALNGVAFGGLDSFSGMLEVSGFRLNDGRIQATYLENRATGRLEIKGVVTAVNSTTSFAIGNLIVSHAGSVAVSTDDLVEVKGSEFIGSTLSATTVSLESAGFSVADKDGAEIEGFVSGSDPISAAEQFLVNGQAVTFSDTTQFEGGTVTDLVNGSKAEAEGVLSAGVLSATKISFKEGVRLESNVASIDAGNGTLTLKGLTELTIIVDGATTELDETTGLSGDSPLALGDHVRIRGQATLTAGTVLATRLRKDSPSAATDPFTVTLRGPSDDPVVVDQISILGISNNTSLLSSFKFFVEDDDGTATETDRANFYSGLAPGVVVKLEGNMNDVDSAPTWNKAERHIEE